jgi:formylglycine-generating enzyme required for sulfatase activity/predicted Ser/Thr protein kinase
MEVGRTDPLARCEACGLEVDVAALDTAVGASPVAATGRPGGATEDGALVGRTLGGYAIEEQIGAGGMGVVYRGKRLRDGQAVAVKVLRLPAGADPAEFRARFRREARVLERLDHPGIVRLLDRGEEEGQPFLVTELIQGKALHRHTGGAPLDEKEALPVLRALCEAIAYAHSQGVIHRDIKPHNVLITDQGIKVLDFGLARIAGSSSQSELTRTNLGLGTLSYLSPEQRMDAKSVDERSDIFSTGVVIYELLTGQLPMGRFELPSGLQHGLDRRWDGIAERCLQVDPGARYESMAALVAELRALQRPRRRRWRVALVGGGALLMVLLGWLLWRGYGGDTGAPDSAPEGSEGGAKPVVASRRSAPPSRPRPIARPRPVAADAAVARRPDAGAGPVRKAAAPGRFVRLAPGRFFMGAVVSEQGRTADEVRHRVTLTRAFELQNTPVTQLEFERLMDYNPSRAQGCGPHCPVEKISWHEAVAYCNALSKKKGLKPCFRCQGQELSTRCQLEARYATPYACKGYRLPTEAEWEYAARAGSSRRAPDGSLASGWFLENSGKKAHRVGRRRPNPWGLYDMLGNVYEWCHDWYGRYSPYSATDPVGPARGIARVGRGCYYGCKAIEARYAHRGRGRPDARDHRIGFRVARTLPR